MIYYTKKIITFLLLFNLCTACAALSPIKIVEKRAYINDNNRIWRIEKDNFTGIGGAYFERDFLKSDFMTVKISLFEDAGYKSFRIFTVFEKTNGHNIVYNNSSATAKFIDGKELNAITFECGGAKQKNTSHDIPEKPLSEDKISIFEGACYYLFFDYPAPSPDNVVLYLNNSFIVDGNNIDIPPIYFRETTRHIYRLGFFQ